MEYHEPTDTLAVCTIRDGVDLYNISDCVVRTGTILLDIPKSRNFAFDMKFGSDGEIVLGGIVGKAHIYRLSDQKLIQSLNHSSSASFPRL
jgi:hypothetical protein